ncbi:LCP family protein [Nocardioides pantholopis]|uniref:LCP family protein n=1 Tax=Nocardioides pantholopis TaxID=2483798 RepID=UPI000F0734C1|nr:LCP family protein [Nocardioides pantholopis]
MPAEQPPGTRPRRTVLKVVIATQLVLALLTGTLVAVAYHRLNGKIGPGAQIEHEVHKSAGAEGKREPLNILLLGSDTRENGNAIDDEGGGGSDLTILLHVSADRSSAYGVSLPRDAMVARPDCEVDGRTVPGEDPVMFNTAYAVGGPLCSVRTVESLTGIYIDHFLALEFGGFVDMVDAVKGVTVCLPQEVDDPEHGIFLDAGTQELDGQDSLSYVRERTVLSATGDIGRMKRQQAFLASLVNKVMSAGTLTRPTRVYDFLAAVTESITVDEDLDSVKALADLAMQFRDTGMSRIRFVTVPFEEYPSDPNRLQWSPAADALWRRIIADRPLGRELGEDSINAGQPPNTGPPTGRGAGSATSGSPRSPRSPGSPGPTEDERAEALANGLCA